MDPNEWLGRNAPGFNRLSVEEREAIKDFSLLWSLFEALVLDTHGSAEGIFAACAQLQKSGRLRIQALTGSIAYFQSRYFEGNSFTAAYDGLHLGKADRVQMVEAFLKGHTEDHVATVAAVLIIVYRFRNNLFHGRKWSYGLEGQLDNFNQANSVLMHVMEL